MAVEQYLDIQAMTETLVLKEQLSVTFTMNVKSKPKENWSQARCFCVLTLPSRAESTDGSI